MCLTQLLVEYDILLVFKFVLLSKAHYNLFKDKTAILKKFRIAYAKGVLRNALVNYIIPRYSKTMLAFIRSIKDYELSSKYLLIHSFTLYNYHGNIVIDFQNGCELYITPKNTPVNIIVLYKILQSVGRGKHGNGVRLIPAGFIKEIRFTEPANLCINGYEKISRNRI